MGRILSERSTQSLSYALVALSGTMAVVVGIRDSNDFIAFGGLVLAVTAVGLLASTLREA